MFRRFWSQLWISNRVWSTKIQWWRWNDVHCFLITRCYHIVVIVAQLKLHSMTLFYDSEWDPGKGAFRRQVDWQQVGALARAGSPVFFFWVSDKSANVKKWQEEVAQNIHFGKFWFNRGLWHLQILIFSLSVFFQMSSFKCFLPKGSNFESNDKVFLSQKNSLSWCVLSHS